MTRLNARPWWVAVLLAAVTVAAAGTVTALTISGAQAATVDPNAWYQIVSRHSGKALDICSSSTADGACVQQWARSSGQNQQFRFVSVGSGYYRIEARHSSKPLELPSATLGTGVVQQSNNGTTRQHWRLADSDSGYVRFINRHSNNAMDIWEWSTSDGGRIAGYSDLNGWNQQWQLVVVGSGGPTNPPPPPPPPGGLVGWATQGGGTTGGAGGSTVTVSSASALTSELSSGSARIIRVSGTISCSGMLRVASNKSVLGNSGATIAGCGLNVSEASNVIIRNINFRDWDDDGINVQYSTRVWIDHNSFSNGYDGALDIKRASDYVTVSWNRFFNHDKTMLLGHSDDNASEDRGHLRVTYHHNWFDGTGQRHPRVRFGNPVHVYNNYYGGVGDYGVASTLEAGVLVEGNYFENTESPCERGQGSSPAASIVQRNNTFVSSGSCASGGSVAGIPYSYNMESSGSVKASVTGGAGAGRISV